MEKLLIRRFKSAMAAGLGLTLLLAVACGAPAATSENVSTPRALAAQAPTAAPAATAA